MTTLELDDDAAVINADAQVDSLEAAIMLAVAHHAGQKDKSGKLYILHPLRVMLSQYPDERAMMVAVLHDVIEDCGVTALNLQEAGFSDDVVDAVTLLSRPGKGTPNRPTHRQYVQSIIDSNNPIAIRVKIADTLDNMSRIHELPPEQRGLLDRYTQSFQILFAHLP